MPANSKAFSQNIYLRKIKLKFMPGNSFGEFFRITTFGESHGPGIGVVIDGCPAGLKVDLKFIQYELDRRRPGQSEITTQRNESDQFEILSGIYNDITLGTPICIYIKNKDHASKDYDRLKEVFRPSHADYTYQAKYGVRDHRGGGRSSARETAARVAAGAIAKLLLSQYHINVSAFVSSVGIVELNKDYKSLDLNQTETNIVRCPDHDTAEKMIAVINKMKQEGNTVGGVISVVASGVPAGLGEPVFDKLHADLGKAILSINAVHGFEYGSGFNGAKLTGKEHNDIFKNQEGKVITETNNSGGIQGGISNGMDIFFRVAFKPVATIFSEQKTIDTSFENTIIQPEGRHDPCVVPRAVPIVEGMTALVLADHLLRNKLSQL